MKTYELEGFVFESRETYETAKREYEMIQILMDKVDFSDEKAALKVYNKFVAEKTFVTVVGYGFLQELRKHLLENGIGTPESLSEIPIREKTRENRDIMPSRPQGESKYRRLYHSQKQINGKLKIALAAVIVLLIGFTAITAGTDYSVFTYFTNYKANMEEELIDKYEKWEEELQARENALEQADKAAIQGQAATQPQ